MVDRLHLDDVVAIDIHVHIELGADGHDHLSPELRAAANRYFRGDPVLPDGQAVADYYRERKMMAVVFPVDDELTTGQPRLRNEDVLAAASANPDVLIPFASIDPRRGSDGVAEARDLVGSVKGFKFHPNMQQFHPNDPIAYPLYEVLAEAGSIALFHTGHSGIGTGLPGGGGIRLKYGNPMDVDDVAVDFPDLHIVLAHPSFPWQDEALSVAMHKPQVSIDLSGWSPKYFPPQLVRHAGSMLQKQVLFGTDFPLITPDRWLADFAALDVPDEVRPLILRENAFKLLGLGG
ncbi:MAG: amidohydrolase family protein [Acidimicrobiia bacterium]